MKVLFKKDLETEWFEKVNSFLKENGACIEQFPQWIYKSGEQNYFLALDSSEKLIAYSLIEEFGKLIKSAQINFGPVISNDVSYLDVISEIVQYYSSRKYSRIIIRLAEPVSVKTELLSYLLPKRYHVKELLDKDTNWTSLKISLTNTLEDIFKKFSKGHKSAVKKAQREGFSVSLAGELQVKQFARIYCEMYASRGKGLNIVDTEKEFERINTLFEQFSLGKTFIINNKEGEIVGGLMIIFQGTDVRYFKGAASPRFRSLPILHLGIYEAIRYSKERGLYFFDLWGYNHLVDEDDQRYQINKFKKGFSSDYTFYARPFEITFSPVKERFRKVIANVKKNINERTMNF